MWIYLPMSITTLLDEGNQVNSSQKINNLYVRSTVLFVSRRKLICSIFETCVVCTEKVQRKPTLGYKQIIFNMELVLYWMETLDKNIYSTQIFDMLTNY